MDCTATLKVFLQEITGKMVLNSRNIYLEVMPTLINEKIFLYEKINFRNGRPIFFCKNEHPTMQIEQKLGLSLAIFFLNFAEFVRYISLKF